MKKNLFFLLLQSQIFTPNRKLILPLRKIDPYRHENVFCDVAKCSLVEVYQSFKGACSVFVVLMMEALSNSEMLVNFYKTAFCNVTEDSHLLKYGLGNLNSYLIPAEFPYCPQGEERVMSRKRRNIFP